MATSYKKGQQFAKDGKTMQIISVNADGTATYAEVDKRTGKLKQGFQGNLPALGGKGGSSSSTPLMDAIAREKEETSGGVSLEDYNNDSLNGQLSDKERFYYNELGFEEIDAQVTLGILTQGEADNKKAQLILDNEGLYEKAQAWDEDLAEDWPVLFGYDDRFPTVKNSVGYFYNNEYEKPLILDVTDEEINIAFDEGRITQEQRNKIFQQRDIAKIEWEEKWPVSRWESRRKAGEGTSEIEQDIYRTAIESLKAKGFSVEKEPYSFTIIDDKTGKIIMQYWPDGTRDEWCRSRHDISYANDMPYWPFYERYDNSKPTKYEQGRVQREDLFRIATVNGRGETIKTSEPTITSEDEIEAAKRDVSKDFIKIAKRARRNSRRNFLRYEDETWRGSVRRSADVLSRTAGNVALEVVAFGYGTYRVVTAPFRAVWKFFTG